MKIYDISMPISPTTPVYPGDPSVQIVPVSSIAKGDATNLSCLSMSCHAGTHLDAPYHMLEGGRSVDQIPLTLLMGRAVVAEIDAGEIGHKELARLPIKGEERLLLKTRNSRLWEGQGFSEEYVSLSSEGAHFLAEAGVKLLGIDYLSIEPFNGDGSIHRFLLGRDIILLEGLNLAEVPPGPYELICLPLRVKGGDGAPVRAVLRRPHEGKEGEEFDPHSTRWPLS